MPTIRQLEQVAREEVAAARLRCSYATSRCCIGVVLSLWVDERVIVRGFGDRVVGRELTGRRIRERKVILWPCHRYPRLLAVWPREGVPGGRDSVVLWVPVRMPISKVAALTCYLIARTSPTPRRVRAARARLRQERLRSGDFLVRPPTTSGKPAPAVLG